MKNIAEVEDALDNKDLDGIEVSFRVLIQAPQGSFVDSVEDPEELVALLDRVTAALEADRNEMPDDLVRELLGEARSGVWICGDRSYAAGARAAAAKNLRWRGFFDARFGIRQDTRAGFGRHRIA